MAVRATLVFRHRPIGNGAFVTDGDYRVTDTPLHLALRELRLDFTNPKGLIALTGVGLIFGVSGPFGTFLDLTLIPRIIYWLVVVFATYATGSVINHYLQFRHGNRLGPFWRQILLLGTATACGVFVVLTVINVVAFGTWFDGARGVALTFGMVWSISVLVVAMLLVFSPLIDDDGDGPPALLDRLPLDKRGPLVSLSAEDHYVAVTTTRGTELILMRLSDAIRETGPVVGLQVHRSHWVALDAVRTATRSGDRAVLTLVDGREITASRSYLPALRAAGLFAKKSDG